MKRTATPSTDHELDADLDSVEEGTLPGGTRVPSKQLLAAINRLANIATQDENATEVTAPTGVGHTDLTGTPQEVRSETAAVTPGSLSKLIGASKGNAMSLNKRIAYAMENGQPFCNHCESYYLPSLGKTACTDCGCGRPNDDHGELDDDFDGEDMSITATRSLDNVEGENVADEVGNKEIIKQDARTASYKLATTDDYVSLFHTKIATDSDNYYRGYNDAMNGVPLDEDLAILSDDYYHGYEDRKYYNKTPQESIKQDLYDMKPNSNSNPRNFQGEGIKPADFDRGPLQLTDGIGSVSAGKVIIPNDIIEKFFEV